MDFWELTKLLVRRWYIALPILLLSFGVAAFTGATVKPDYQSTQHLQLIPPVSIAPTTAGKPHNPWNDLGVVAIGNAAIIGVGDKSFLDQLTEDGLSDTFTVTLDPRSPIVTVQSVGHDPQQAIDTTNAVVQAFSKNISQLQSAYGVPQDQLITTHSLDSGSNVEKVTSKVKRALAVIGGTGLLVTAAATIGLDALLRKRSRRRAARAREADPGEAATEERATGPDGNRDRGAGGTAREPAGGPTIRGTPQAYEPPRWPDQGMRLDGVPAGRGTNGVPRVPAGRHPEADGTEHEEPRARRLDDDATIVLPRSIVDVPAGRDGRNQGR